MADNYTFKDASGSTQTGRSKDTGSGIQATVVIPSDVSGNMAIVKVPAIFYLRALGSTNANNVKNASGALLGYDLHNRAAYEVFVKFYDKATAPTVGTDAPISIIALAPYEKRDVMSSLGLIPFATGISVAITKLIANSDTTAVVADDVIMTLRYV